MAITNISKRTILADFVEAADNPFTRIKGLLGRKTLEPGQALLIKPCNGVHTFFMAFPIDVLFVGKDYKVIKAIASLKPNRMTAVYFDAVLTIELPAGTIQKTRTTEGDFLEF